MAIVRNDPVLLSAAQQRCEDLLAFAAQSDPANAVRLALQSIGSFFAVDYKETCIAPAVHYLNENLPHFIGRDDKLALRASAAAVRLSGPHPDIQQEAIEKWQQIAGSLISSDPMEVADAIVDQACHRSSDRVAVKEAWTLWEQTTREVFSRNPIHGIGMALCGVTDAERQIKMQEYSHATSQNPALGSQSPPEQARLGQMRGFLHYAVSICGDLCDQYKQKHPLGALRRAAQSYSLPDGANPMRRHPAINMVKGLGKPNIALSCMADWLKAPPQPQVAQISAWERGMFL